MTGRGKKTYTIKLQKHKKDPSYELLFHVKISSKSRIDRLGLITANNRILL